MARAVELVQSGALPHFEATATLAGFDAYLAGRLGGGDHHVLLGRARCAARLGRPADASALALRAIARYCDDGRDWCGGYIALAEQLVEALARGAADELLDAWRQQSIAGLRLSKLAGAVRS